MWELIESTVKDEGFFLFDLDLPVGRRGTMRVFITGDDQKGLSVKLDDCTRVSRRLNTLLDVEDETETSYVLEVSSPGVNRRLRKQEHFAGAVGEHVRINMQLAGKPGRAVYGTLVECTDSTVTVREDKVDKSLEIPFSAIKDARVDFIFDT